MREKAGGGGLAGVSLSRGDGGLLRAPFCRGGQEPAEQKAFFAEDRPPFCAARPSLFPGGSMWKQTVQLLGVLMMMFSAVTSASAGDVMSYEGSVGEVNVRVMALGKKELKADILRPGNEEQKAAVAACYPDGTIGNYLNLLLLRGHGVAALVDTGFEWTGKELDAALAQAGLSLGDVTHVLITHAHTDHVGGLLRDGKPVFPSAQILFSAKELAYWTNPAAKAAAAGGARATFETVADVVRLYGERVRTFEPGTDLFSQLPGVRAVDEPGHTPGHVGIMVTSGKDTFLFWSDVLHAFDVQTKYPSVSTSFDMNAEEAARVRREILDRARAEGWLVVGTHVPFVQPRVLEK